MILCMKLRKTTYCELAYQETARVLRALSWMLRQPQCSVSFRVAPRVSSHSLDSAMDRAWRPNQYKLLRVGCECEPQTIPRLHCPEPPPTSPLVTEPCFAWRECWQYSLVCVTTQSNSGRWPHHIAGNPVLYLRDAPVSWRSVLWSLTIT